MKDRISALMDGELESAELDESMKQLKGGGEALETWRRYHLISDAMRDTQLLSSGFSARLAARIESEPTVLAPAAAPRRVERSRAWFPLSAAASVAGIALVGSLAYQSFGPDTTMQVAQTKAPERKAPVVQVVPMPGAVNDYLLAHQNYSPRSSLQGVAPYVRTVSDSARPR